MDALVEGPQQPYRPASKANAIGTLVPTNMRTSVQDALHTTAQKVGNLDHFVAKELGYKPEDIAKYFSAEQVDALSLAINQMKNGKGFIIGDQTGIGKGRVVAGVIRWALKNGNVPTFVTEKPNLYADMFRDLTDIDVKDIRPIMTNGGETVPLDEAGNVTLKTPPSLRHNANLTAMTNEASLGQYNIIFTTYSQMQGIKGSEARTNFMRTFATNGVLIFDESHNAGGTDAGGRGKKKNDGDDGKTGRAGFARELAKLAKSVFYSSATYAKRPSVMDLYFKTDMALAVDGDVKKLPNAIAAGGVPLQQVVASMLSESGQYIRRERSFAGVEYNTPRVPVDLAAAERISSMMMAVNTFSRAKESLIEEIKEQIKSEAKQVSGDNSVGQAGVDSSNFTSVMHNMIDQMLLGLKADAAVERAIAALKAGEKPVITVSNTMGSFIQEYAEEAGLKTGDTMALSFKDLLFRYLEKERYITIKDVEGKKTRKRLSDTELGPKLLNLFNTVKAQIKDSTNLESVPISPIDWIHYKLQAAGYTSSEITGRSHTIRYHGGSKKPTYQMRPTTEGSIAGRRKTIIGFNNGTIDALVLNQSGSTGLSLHASEKFKDQRRRRMIIAQAEKNIDTHMQMLGRVHRTGQVVAPAYDQMVADIPAENRPAAVLSKKMASLNANTTGARSSQFSAKDTLDFMNAYGDEVVAGLMTDLPDLHMKLGEPLKMGDDGYEIEDAARKVTGRLPLLTVAEQNEFYKLLESNYRDLLARADALGENALEAKTLDLDAKSKSQTQLFDGKAGESSPFAAGAVANVMDVKRLGKPYSSAQVLERLTKETSLPEGSSLDDVRRALSMKAIGNIGRVRAEFNDYMTGELKKLAESEMDDSAKEGRAAMLHGLLDAWEEQARVLIPGKTFAIRTPENTTFYGVLQNVTRKDGVKLPVARGSWIAHFDVADGMREISFPFSKIKTSMEPVGNEVHVSPAAVSEFLRTPIMKMFDDGQTASREDRVIVTGNLLAGFSKVGKGQITNFTDHEGRIQQGVLMPKNFDLKEFAAAQPVQLAQHQIPRFFELAPQGILVSSDGLAQLRKNNHGFMLTVPKSKAEGGKYFLNQNLREITGDFFSGGGTMRAEIYQRDLPNLLNVLESQFGQSFRAETHKDEAKAAGGSTMGKPKPQFQRGAVAPDGMHPDVPAYLDKVTRALGQDVNVMRHATPAAAEAYIGQDVPEDTAGAYTPDTNTIHFIESNLDTVEKAQEILRHEGIGHYAMEHSAGFKDALALLGRLKDKGGPRITKLWNQVEAQQPGLSDLDHRKEVIAKMAELGVSNSIIDRAIAGVTGLLRKVGVEIPTEAQLRAMIVLAARQLPPEARELAGMGDTKAQDDAFQPEYPQPAEPSRVLFARGTDAGDPHLAALHAKYGKDTGERGPQAYEAARRLVTALPNSELALSVRRLIDPVNLSDLSRETARMTTDAFGKLARDTEEATAQLEQYAKMVDKLPPQDLLDAIHAIETGAPQPNRALQPMADTLRSMLDIWRTKVQDLGVGALDTWIENYFPHIWQDPGKARKLVGMIMGRRPMKGPATFLKKRTIPTLKEGMDLGLRPLTINPLTLALIKAREMQRFVTGVRLMQKLKDSGLARFLPASTPTPEGWKEINDAAGKVRYWSDEAGGFVDKGRYVMPEEAARIINNHLTGSALANWLPAQVLRMGSNMLNAAQLGVSAFHLGFTTMDVMISKNALAIERMLHGEPLRAVEAMLEANVAPIGVGLNIRRGLKLLRAYSNIAGATPQMQALVRALEAGGGRVRMDESYQTAQGISPFKGVGVQSLIHDVHTALTQPTGKIEGLTRTLGSFPLDYATKLLRDMQTMGKTFPAWQIPFEVAGRMVRASTSIIMEHIVPLQKLGVFSDLASDWLRRNPNATAEAHSAAMQSIWRSVDNRMGEMVYDNLYWNRTFKDITQMSVRAVGWNYGTVAELGGAATDIMGLLDKKARGGKISAEDVGHTIPYGSAETAATMLIGATLTYLFTGKGPQELKDYFFAPTGYRTKWGTPQRVSLPSYAKDVYEYANDPFGTAANKLNPIFGLIHDVWTNQDYQNRAIYSPESDTLDKAKDIAAHVGREATPFSMQQRTQIGGADGDTLGARIKRGLPFVGVNVAPGRISSPEQLDRAQRLRKAQSFIGSVRQEMKAAQQSGDRERVMELAAREQKARQEVGALAREVQIDRARRKASIAQGNQ